ncbi:WD40 repeat domain-containing protein, partial [Kitasatospora phosalacinea]|uniref:WD40 repeat domain-containing protein n=1 Tax=Kitasatospora phosalacinea TaxID=2065 RepID=UPI002552D0B4
MSEDDQADGVEAFSSLPAVKEAVQALASAMNRAGVVTEGDPLLECDEHEFMERWKELRRRNGTGEPLVVHFAGHGAQSKQSRNLYLAMSGGEARDDLLIDTCVSFGRLLEEAENSGRPVLFLLDVCEAGQAIVQQQLIDLAARRRQDALRNVWIIGACTSDSITYGARFTTATAEVLHQLVDGNLDISPTMKYVPIDTLTSAIDRELARADRAARRPGQALVRTPHIQAVPEPQPFFRNPSHTHDPQAGLLTAMNPRLREFALGCAPGLDPLHFATRAAGNPTANSIHFSGRRSQLQRIQNWIDNPDGTEGRLLVVTGGPGSGKSALLGVTACLLHPELESIGDQVGPTVEHFAPRMPSTVLAVHARQLSLQQITESLRRQLHRQSAGQIRPHDGSHEQSAESPDHMGTAALLRDLRDVNDVLVVLDALDEAIDPTAVLNELLLPLAGAADSSTAVSPRVVIGTRPWWDTLTTLRDHLADHHGTVLNLDPSTDEDRRVLADDLDDYLRKLLPRRRYPRPGIRHIADALAAYSDSGAFLVAALYADHLLTSNHDISGPPPRTITEVFNLHIRSLTANDPWVLPVLTVLGQARGQGMPLDLIHAAALAHQPPFPHQATPHLSDTRRALTKAAFYLRTASDTDQRLLYRYFHQALTDHTKSQSDPAVIHHALISTVATDGTPNWSHAQPYLLRHAADHAAIAANGALDRLLADPQFLVHAEPDSLTPLLHRATTGQAILNTHIYRTTTTHHPLRRHRHTRRSLLALDAASWQQVDLARAISNVALDGRPANAVPLWATRQTHPARRHTLLGSTSPVRAVATAIRPDGTPLAITIDRDSGSAIVWDLTTGDRLHILTSPTGPVLAVATAIRPDGTPLAITTSNNEIAVVWDLTTGTHLHNLTAENGSVRAVATTARADGTPLAITANRDSGTATVWDLTTGTQLHALTSHAGSANAVATATRADGTPLGITTSDDGTAIVWDLTTGAHLHTLTTSERLMRSVAVATRLDGSPLGCASDSNYTATVWDLETGAHLHTLSAGWVRTLTTVAQAGGMPLGITTSDDGTATVWDLTTGNRLHILTSPAGPVLAVATAIRPDGTPLAITTSYDETAATVWDLTTGTRLHTLTGHTSPVRVVTTSSSSDGAPLAITASDDGAVIVWDLRVNARLHTLTAHHRAVNAVAVAALPSAGPIVITASEDGTAIVWNLATGGQLRTLSGYSGPVSAVATTIRPDGTPLAVIAGASRTVTVWDLTTGTQLSALTGHASPVSAVATTIRPDGTPLAVIAGASRTVTVWDLTTGTQLSALTGHASPVSAVATTIRPDGTPLAITTSYDGIAIVWNLATGGRLHILRGHSGPVSAVAT